MNKNIEKRIKEIIHKIDALSCELNFAVDYMENDPAGSLNKSRIVLEIIILDVFTTEMEQEPKKKELGFILKNNQFTRKIENRIVSRMNFVRTMGNIGSHPEPILYSEDALQVLTNLCEIMEWYINRYDKDSISNSKNNDTEEPKPIKNTIFTKKLLIYTSMMLTSLVMIFLSYSYIYNPNNYKTISEYEEKINPENRNNFFKVNTNGNPVYDESSGLSFSLKSVQAMTLSYLQLSWSSKYSSGNEAIKQSYSFTIKNGNQTYRIDVLSLDTKTQSTEINLVKMERSL